MTLSRKSQNIDDYNWYYEEPKGIVVVHEVRHNKEGGGPYIRTDILPLIPWRQIRISLKRKDKKKQ